MSAGLARLISVDEQALVASIAKLEKATGHQSIDNRLFGSLRQETDRAAEGLGLSKDYTPKELYYASISAAKQLDEHLWGNYHDLTNAVKGIADKAESVASNFSTLSIKKTALLKMLQANPPKTVLKQSGYKTVGSLVKSLPVYEVVAWAKVLESKTWLEKWQRACSKLTIRSYDVKKVQISLLSPQLLPQKHKIDFSSFAVLPVYECGLVAVIIPEHKAPVQKGLLLLVALLMQDAVEEFLANELYIRFMRTQPTFLKSVAAIYAGEQPKDISIEGVSFGWDVLASVLKTAPRKLLPESLKTYMTKSDLKKWDSNSLFDHRVWKSLEKDWLGAEIHGKLVTLSSIDVAYNLYYGLEFEDRVRAVFGKRLHKELFYRYAMDASMLPLVLDAIDAAIEGDI